jgi:hypothetical protein
VSPNPTFLNISLQYIAMRHIVTRAIDQELKKGSVELLILFAARSSAARSVSRLAVFRLP